MPKTHLPGMTYEEFHQLISKPINQHKILEEVSAIDGLTQNVCRNTAHAYKVMMHAKDDVDRLKGERFIHHQKLFIASGESSAEKKCEAAAATDPLTVKAKTTHRDLEAEHQEWDGLLSSFRNRSFSLREAGMYIRKGWG